MARLTGLLVVLGFVVVSVGCEAIRGEEEQGGTAAQAAAAQAPPAATKIEGFRPAAGSVVTFGYDELGSVTGVSVDVRELRDAKGGGVRGLLVEVTESEYRKERSFVDAVNRPGFVGGRIP